MSASRGARAGTTTATGPLWRSSASSGRRRCEAARYGLAGYTLRYRCFPRDAELLAFEAACEDYCEREVDEVEWQGGRVYLHLGARRDDPPRG